MDACDSSPISERLPVDEDEEAMRTWSSDRLTRTYVPMQAAQLVSVRRVCYELRPQRTRVVVFKNRCQGANEASIGLAPKGSSA